MQLQNIDDPVQNSSMWQNVMYRNVIAPMVVAMIQKGDLAKVNANVTPEMVNVEVVLHTRIMFFKVD